MAFIVYGSCEPRDCHYEVLPVAGIGKVVAPCLAGVVDHRLRGIACQSGLQLEGHGPAGADPFNVFDCNFRLHLSNYWLYL